MKLIPYTSDHFYNCIELFQGNCPPYFDPKEETYFKHWLEGLSSGKYPYDNIWKNHFYIIQQENQIVACGGFYVLDDKKTARMSWGMVARENHNKGIGTELLRLRLKCIRKEYPFVDVKMDTSQHTVKFYEKMGFKTIEITKNAYGLDLHKHEMILPSNQE